MEALEASEARFRVMAETVPAILFTADRHGQLDYASPRFFEVTGLSPSMAGAPVWSELVHPDDLARINRAWRRSITLGEPFAQEVRFRTAGRDYCWFLAQGSPICNAEGRIERWFGAAIEIDQLKRTEERLRRTNDTLTGILASIGDFYYTLDDRLRVTAMNPQAAAFAGVDLPDVLGQCILDIFPALRGSAIEAAYRDALSKQTSVHLESPAIMRPGHWLEVNIYPFESGLSVFSRDVTSFRRAEHDVHELSGRLLRSQDEERRRIARELHDSYAQNMAAIAFNLQRMCEASANPLVSTQALAQESLDMVKQSLAEVRTLSYLLHPPLLDEIGLAAALRWYVDGFEKRSGIKVSLWISTDLGRLSSDAEIALFRVVQESLVNVHRHAHSETAAIRLCRSRTKVTLTVTDRGAGIPTAVTAAGNDYRSFGVGIPGMSARLRQLGGRLDVVSLKRGTKIQAILPQEVMESPAILGEPP